MKLLKKLIIPFIVVSLVLGFFAYKTKGDLSKSSIMNVINFTESGSEAKQPDSTFDTALHTTKDEVKIPYVRTAVVIPADKNTLGLSGIVRARHKTPLAFQIGGRITFRDAEVGQQIKKGETLFKLDDRDIHENINTAQADVTAAQANVNSAQANVTSAQANVNSAKNDVSSAQARLATTLSELKRSQLLHKKRVISTQILEQAQLAERQAREQVNSAKARVTAAKASVSAVRARVNTAKAQVKAAKARLGQAGNTKGYTSLRSPKSGVLLNVTGQIGQVVGSGQAVALLALDGQREIEVSFPDYRKPPKTGILLTANRENIPLILREISATVDPQSRTWQARYTIKSQQAFGLGSIVRTEFGAKKSAEVLLSIPISALDERGKQAQVWQVVEGHAQTKAVTVVRLTTDTAIIKGNLGAGESVISLGTHLLTPNKAVQELTK